MSEQQPRSDIFDPRVASALLSMAIGNRDVFDRALDENLSLYADKINVENQIDFVVQPYVEQGKMPRLRLLAVDTTKTEDNIFALLNISLNPRVDDYELTEYSRHAINFFQARGFVPPIQADRIRKELAHQIYEHFSLLEDYEAAKRNSLYNHPDDFGQRPGLNVEDVARTEERDTDNGGLPQPIVSRRHPTTISEPAAPVLTNVRESSRSEIGESPEENDLTEESPTENNGEDMMVPAGRTKAIKRPRIRLVEGEDMRVEALMNERVSENSGLSVRRNNMNRQSRNSTSAIIKAPVNGLNWLLTSKSKSARYLTHVLSLGLTAKLTYGVLANRSTGLLREALIQNLDFSPFGAGVLSVITILFYVNSPAIIDYFSGKIRH